MRRIGRQDIPRTTHDLISMASESFLAPIQVVADSMLCRLHVWTEEEWALLPENERPLKYTHAPGLGWVGAIAIEGLN